MGWTPLSVQVVDQLFHFGTFMPFPLPLPLRVGASIPLLTVHPGVAALHRRQPHGAIKANDFAVEHPRFR